MEHIVERMGLRFTGGNSVPVERAHITREEWGAVVAQMRALVLEVNHLRARVKRLTSWELGAPDGWDDRRSR